MSEKWIKRKKMERAKLLAEEHWEWTVKWFEMFYKDCIIHGYSHGYKDEKKEILKE